MSANGALVTIAPAGRDSLVALSVPATAAAGRARADFIAHLIATSAQAPQTRARRRAEPAEAIAAYGALGHWPTAAGGGFSRSL